MLSGMVRQSGYSAVELMVGVVITATLLAVGTPMLTSLIQNSRISTAAESLQNGLQLARTEAVRRNEAVLFTLGTGSSWTVLSVANPNPPIQSRSRAEGTVNVTLAITPASASSATFNGLGQLIANADGSSALANIEVAVPSAVLPTGQMRKLEVSISSGGQIRVCDPHFTAPDPRAC